MRILLAAVLVFALGGCGDRAAPDEALNQADASGNAAANALENAVDASSLTPLEKDEALALMKQRHDNYEKIGDAMKVLTRELKSDSPNLGEVRARADVIAALAPQVPTWFPAGTGPDVGKTHAKPVIWEQPEDFAAKARNFDAAAKAFQAAARGEDLAAIRAAHADLGKSCKACHDIYREKD